MLEEKETKINKKEGPSFTAPSPRPRSVGNKFWEDKEFETKLLDLDRVTRVTGGGKHLRFRALIVVGNKIGKVGIGVAKGSDVPQAIEKATKLAKKHLIEVPIVGDTIPHEVSAKFGAAKVLLKPQKKGRGLVAGGTVRVICNLAGIKNISSKVLGTTKNKINNAKATIVALKKLKTRE
ncbi:MAG: 30S ribosomal protein S5 [Candidatus Nealsonbacteria bacterium CG_4_10_14_0_8_um_filter_35_10]|uniref:Small ribosomal subunit protein uS5 n=2 Tax=Candidatus Nealsoniibacteriota TaxID=1817911 RepID=A0A2M7R8V1_9BACT|nr:MAG: 30S ribosomal protein S5 [Candidatus Nealsonbacteria bacterium CG_4_10_14_0_8_um_filter_35_10]PJB99699.1 MAG: 30S ribosomal protein S5 [Candidatus Nealsonbacteria bacterium CG_4_9_14_0_8_um_filter_35_12]